MCILRIFWLLVDSGKSHRFQVAPMGFVIFVVSYLLFVFFIRCFFHFPLLPAIIVVSFVFFSFTLSFFSSFFAFLFVLVFAISIFIFLFFSFNVFLLRFIIYLSLSFFFLSSFVTPLFSFPFLSRISNSLLLLLPHTPRFFYILLLFAAFLSDTNHLIAFVFFTLSQHYFKQINKKKDKTLHPHALNYFAFKQPSSTL